jgi:hypothetical protein
MTTREVLDHVRGLRVLVVPVRESDLADEFGADDTKELSMKLMTFAAGLAAGYVLGARAGREKYEQIAGAFTKARSHPAVTEARPAASDLVTNATESPATSSPIGDSSPRAASPRGASPRPRRPRTQATVTAPSVTADPVPEA